MSKQMTDNEIIKALECCEKSSTILACEECPVLDTHQCVGTPKTYVSNFIIKQSIDLINRLKAENKVLTTELEQKTEMMANLGVKLISYEDENERLQKAIKVQEIMIGNQPLKLQSARNGAYKEFAEKLKEKAYYCEKRDRKDDFVVNETDIDNLVKEMTENITKIEHNSLCETETYEGVTDTNVGCN